VLDRLYRGGTEMQALDVCRNAGRNGLDLSVASGGGALEGEFRDSGVQYHSFRRRAPLDLFLVHRLRQLIKGNHYNIVHTHQAVDALHRPGLYRPTPCARAIAPSTPLTNAAASGDA